MRFVSFVATIKGLRFESECRFIRLFVPHFASFEPWKNTKLTVASSLSRPRSIHKSLVWLCWHLAKRNKLSLELAHAANKQTRKRENEKTSKLISRFNKQPVDPVSIWISVFQPIELLFARFCHEQQCFFLTANIFTFRCYDWLWLCLWRTTKVPI